MDTLQLLEVNAVAHFTATGATTYRTGTYPAKNPSFPLILISASRGSDAGFKGQMSGIDLTVEIAAYRADDAGAFDTICGAIEAKLLADTLAASLSSASLKVHGVTMGDTFGEDGATTLNRVYQLRVYASRLA